MNVRIVVADERQANFFDASSLRAAPKLCDSMRNPTAGLKDIDLETDRDGRRYGGFSGTSPGGNPVGATHHGVDGERSTEAHELTLFAKHVADRIEEGRVNNQFDRLVIVAGPRMLGLLRESLPKQAASITVAEVAKDIVQHEPRAILEAVPREAFSTLP